MTEDEMVGWHHQLNGHEFEYREGVENQDGNWIGCRVAQNWNLHESDGADSDCSVVQFLWDISSALSSLPLPLGRVSNINKPKARSLSGLPRS